MNPTTLLLDRDGAVLWVRLNRPDARNAIDTVMRDELGALLVDADHDPEVRCLVVTGQGGDFCTGADLMPADDPGQAARRPQNALDYTRAVGPWQQLFQTYWEVETPVVSAVNGTTAGAGWMLALLADLVVGARDARWIHAFSRRGMVPHAGDPFFLPRLLPFHRLNEAALLGDRFTSEDLHAWSAVNRLVDGDEVEATARELSLRLAAGPTRSLGQTKRLYRRSLVSDMATAFAEEASATALVSQTHDRQEGVRALLEGRSPEFTGA
ncbi:MAG: enoyl-CoA hydratase/isomerase family protein [Acidimicrobiia bacterium]